tara:strand:- start:291 stop:1061 length:771 start_codon:yes stop_codon:yes gene_type:complete
MQTYKSYKMENKQLFPTEEVTLPSKGLIYSPDNPLSKGVLEMKYMTAKEEDILTNESYIKNGTVIDKLLKSLIVTPIDYNDIVVGDKNAVMIAARVLGYGKDYTFKIDNEEHTVDLTEVEDKILDEKDLLTKGQNGFEFTLPTTKKTITFKLLTHGDEKKIDNEVKGIKRVKKGESPEYSTRLKHMILSVDGESESKTIREFVDTQLLARDARALRQYIKAIQPDVDLLFNLETEAGEKEVRVPIGITFFWPDSEL